MTWADRQVSSTFKSSHLKASKASDSSQMLQPEPGWYQLSELQQGQVHCIHLLPTLTPIHHYHPPTPIPLPHQPSPLSSSTPFLPPPSTPPLSPPHLCPPPLTTGLREKVEESDSYSLIPRLGPWGLLLRSQNNSFLAVPLHLQVIAFNILKGD